MPETKYITATCTIKDQAVFKNGAPLFEGGLQNISDFLLSLYHHFGIKYPRFYKMDNLSKLGWLAAEVLLKDNFEKEKYKPEDVGLVLANANSSLDTDIKYYETTKDIGSPALFVYTLPNIMTGEICIRHNFKGENAFFISEKFEADFIRQYVNNLFNNNTLQACIFGWVDLIGDQYKAVLYLVERNPGLTPQPSKSFSTENIIKIYQLENG